MSKLYYIKIDGKEKLIKRANRLRYEMPLGVMRGFNDGANLLIDTANDNLYENLVGNSVPTEERYMVAGYSLGYQDTPIYKGWKTESITERPDEVVMDLINTSQHAAHVEFGTGTPIVPRGDYLRIKFKDGSWRSVPYVRGQEPKSYLRSAMLTTEDEILEKVRIRCKRVINMVTAGVI